MKTRLALHIPILLALLVTPPSGAAVTFNGFGQVIAGSTPDDDKPFPALAYDGDVAFKPESLFALQAQAPLAPDFDAVAQIVARGSDDFKAEFTWAYVRYQLNDALSLKVGRQRIPFYRYSDYLEVGSAYPFIRPPRSIYDNDVSNGDGLTLRGSYSVGRWSLQPQLQYLEVDNDVKVSGTDVHLRLKNLIGASIEAAYDDWLNLRASYFHTKISAELAAAQPLFDGLATSGETDAANELGAEDDSGTFFSAGFDITRDKALFGGEYVYYTVPHTFFGSSNRQFYFNAGYRWNKLTPIIVWGRAKGGLKNDALQMTDPANPLYPAVAGFIASTQRKDDFMSFGLRYDLRDNVALKADYTLRTSAIDGVPNARLLSAGVVFTF